MRHNVGLEDLQRRSAVDHRVLLHQVAQTLLVAADGDHHVIGPTTIKSYLARGELRLGGALAEPADEALLVFKGEDGSAAEAFARADPYVREGLVRRWTVRRWTVVIGADFAD